MVDSRLVTTPGCRLHCSDGPISEGGRDSRTGFLSPDTQLDEGQATDAEIDRLAAALTRLLADLWRSDQQGRAASLRGAVGGQATEHDPVSISVPATISAGLAGCPPQTEEL